MQAAISTTLGVFGYLPGQPDFVRVRAAGREVRRLEDWLERGLHQARWEMGGGFSAAYPRLFHRFIFRPDNSERVVLGVMCASLDCHKRPFPFVAFDLIPTELWDRSPAEFIASNGAFFAELEQLVRTVGPLSHIGQVHGQVVGTRATMLFPDSQASADEEARYLNFLQETACGELGSSDIASGSVFFHDLIATIGSGQDPRLLRQALALILRRPAFSKELELRFYLNFLLTLLVLHRPTVTLFWQLGGTAPGSVILSFREPALDIFSALLCEGGGARGVYRPGSAGAPLLRPHPEWNDESSLYTLLAAIAPRPQGMGKNQRRSNGKGT